MPVLMFDSGVGGLSILPAVRALVPDRQIIYAADLDWLPYGLKTEAQLIARVPALLAELAQRYNPAIVVIACNTASTIALDAVRTRLDVPVVGTVPAIKPAAERTKSNVIGVLGTPATVRQVYLDDLERKFASHCTVHRHGSSALVMLAEQFMRTGTVDPEAVRAAVLPLFVQDETGTMDQVVLACTHFPLLRPVLDAVVPAPVNWVDSAEGIARRVRTLLDRIASHSSDAAPRCADRAAVTTGSGQQDASADIKALMARYGFSGVDVCEQVRQLEA